MRKKLSLLCAICVFMLAFGYVGIAEVEFEYPEEEIFELDYEDFEPYDESELEFDESEYFEEITDDLDLETDIVFADVPEYLPFAEEIYTLAMYDFVKGDLPNEEGVSNFRPYDVVRRSEFAAIVCRILGVEEEANSAMGVTPFSDVVDGHWASGYINTVVKYGAVNGYPDGSFRPDNPVSNAEAIKMIIAGMGHNDDAMLAGGFPIGYAEVANTYQMLDSLSYNFETPSKRWVTSVMAYGALATLPNLTGLEAPENAIYIGELFHDEPFSEHYGFYNADPVSLLKAVTLPRARYEARTITQIVPLEHIPEGFSGSVTNYYEYVQDTYTTDAEGNVVRITSLPDGFNLATLFTEFDTKHYEDARVEGSDILGLTFTPVLLGVDEFAINFTSSRPLQEEEMLSLNINTTVPAPISELFEGHLPAEEIQVITYSALDLDTEYDCVVERTIVDNLHLVLSGKIKVLNSEAGSYTHFTGTASVVRK